MWLLMTFFTSYVLLASVDAALSWRDVLSMLGLVAPVVFGVILYLVKRQYTASYNLQESKVAEAREHVDRQLVVIKANYAEQLATMAERRAQQKENLAKLEDALRVLTVGHNQLAQELLGHQNTCSSKFVMRDIYVNDLAAQKEHIRTIKELINQQYNMVETLIK